MTIWMDLPNYAAMRKYYIEKRAHTGWSDDTLDMMASAVLRRLFREEDSIEAIWDRLKEQDV